MRMNIRIGKSGFQEGTALLSLVLTTGGLFSIDSEMMYSRGNSSYIAMPLSAALSLLLFLLILSAMRRANARNTHELFARSLGIFAKPVGLASAFILIFAGYAPLSQFVRAMHGLFFEGVTYSRLIVFILPAVLVTALFGLETISRCAKVYSLLLLAVFIAVFAASAPQFELYRLYPLPFGAAGDMLRQLLRGVSVAFPAFFALLATSDGFNGLENTRRIGISGAVISFVILLAAHLALSLTYNFDRLSSLFMPLFRINYLNMFEAHLMRMDKIANIIWLNGAMLSGAFYFCAASRIIAASFSIRDIRPPLTVSALFCGLLILFENEIRCDAVFTSIKNFIFDTGFLLLSAPIITASAIAFIRGNGAKNKCEA